MAQLNSFRELVVWQKAMDLAETCYLLTRPFSRQDEALGNEIRKSCVSIPSNIAEGFGRHSSREYVHHLWISNGSGNELQTQIGVGHRVKIVSDHEAATIIRDTEEVGRMLRGLARSISKRF